MTDGRERDITRAFVALSSSLVNGGDIVDLLTELTSDCARLLDIESAGLLLADLRGVLHVIAASSERTRNLELFQLQRDEGPCRDCFHSGTAVSVADLKQEAERWPQFAAAADAAGFASVHALPMRLHDTVLGALGLFSTSVGSPDADDLSLAQALAHVASVALVADRVSADRSVVHEQLQSALSSRVLVEQAKGLLAQLGTIEMHEAFGVLRRYSRDNNQPLTDVARQLVGRELDGRALLNHALAAGVLARTPR